MPLSLLAWDRNARNALGPICRAENEGESNAEQKNCRSTGSLWLPGAIYVRQHRRTSQNPNRRFRLGKARYGAEADLFVTETEAVAMSDNEDLVVEGKSYRAIPDRREWTVDRPRPGTLCPAMTTCDLKSAWSVPTSSRALWTPARR